MIFLFCLIIFVLGISIGSFLGVVVDRLGSKESVWKGRSHCDHCRHNLHAFDLIPIASFFLLGQKCRYCHKKLSWFYPLVEIVSGLTYVSASYVVFTAAGPLFLQTQYVLLLFYYFILTASLLVIFFTDLRYGIIPFNAVITAFLATIIWYLLVHVLIFPSVVLQSLGLQVNVLSVILSALCAGGFFLLLFVITKGRGMGFGDVIYAFLMGFTLGFPRVLLGLYIAFVTGALVSLALVALKRKKLKGGTIPFGPFLVFGTLVSLLWGSMIVSVILQYITF